MAMCWKKNPCFSNEIPITKTYTKPSDTYFCPYSKPQGWNHYASGAMAQRAQDFAFKTDIFGVGAMA